MWRSFRLLKTNIRQVAVQTQAFSQLYCGLQYPLTPLETHCRCVEHGVEVEESLDC